MSARWHGTPSTARRLSARSSNRSARCRRSAPPMSPLIPVTSTAGRLIGGPALADRRVDEVRDELEPLRVPGVGQAAVREVRERHARVPIAPPPPEPPPALPPPPPPP